MLLLSGRGVFPPPSRPFDGAGLAYGECNTSWPPTQVGTPWHGFCGVEPTVEVGFGCPASGSNPSSGYGPKPGSVALHPLSCIPKVAQCEAGVCPENLDPACGEIYFPFVGSFPTKFTLSRKVRAGLNTGAYGSWHDSCGDPTPPRPGTIFAGGWWGISTATVNQFSRMFISSDPFFSYCEKPFQNST